MPGETLHILFDNYDETEEQNYLSKGRNESSKQRDVTNLNQNLPKPSDWQVFLSNSKNKQKLTYLLSDYFVLPNIINKMVYVTKGKYCFKKSGEDKVEIQNLESKQQEADHTACICCS